MLLKEKLLEDFTKEEMLGVAKHFGLNKVSSLKKDALIEKIVERFCSEDELLFLNDNELRFEYKETFH